MLLVLVSAMGQERLDFDLPVNFARNGLSRVVGAFRFMAIAVRVPRHLGKVLP